MPVSFLTLAQRHQLIAFPEPVDDETRIAQFTLSSEDKHVIPHTSSAHNRVAFALQLCLLRAVGYYPEELANVSTLLIQFVAEQLNILTLPDLKAYAQRGQTRTTHQQQIATFLGFCYLEPSKKIIQAWLAKRALEHHRPSLLLELLLAHLYQLKIVRPTISQLERLVAKARATARQVAYARIAPLLTDSRQAWLDSLLEVQAQRTATTLVWLRQRATQPTPEALLSNLAKLQLLDEAHVASWDLSPFNPNYLKQLAHIAKTSTNQALQRSAPARRYPILVAFLKQALAELTDETIDLFEQCLGEAYRRSKTSLKKHRERVAKSTNNKVRWFNVLASFIIDEEIADNAIRKHVYQKITKERLVEELKESNQLIRPDTDHYYDFLADRYSHLRKFIPQFLKTLTFYASFGSDSLLTAISLLDTMNQQGLRKVPLEAPLDFVNDNWAKYVLDKQGRIQRKYYELCTLWELRQELRSGAVWVKQSQRYSDPEQYLMPEAKWQSSREAVCQLLDISSQPQPRLEQRKLELNALLQQLNQQLPKDPKLRIEEDRLVITPTEAEEESPAVIRLREEIAKRLPRIDLPDLLIEVNSWVNYLDCLHHLAGQKPDPIEAPTCLFAAILAEAMNLGYTAMADSSNLAYARLIWYSNWYLQEEALNRGVDKVINSPYAAACKARSSLSIT